MVAPEFKGQRLGREPDPNFFDRLVDMPICEAADELHDARIWAIWRHDQLMNERRHREAMNVQALLSKINSELRRVNVRRDSISFYNAIRALYGQEAVAKVHEWRMRCEIDHAPDAP